MSKRNFFRFLACFSIMVGSLCSFIHSANAYSPQLKSLPEGSYQLARSIFLPKAKDDFWVPNGDYNNSPCKDMGYPLKECPAQGICSKCPLDSSFLKLNSCKTVNSQKYRVSANGLTCEPYCDYSSCDISTYPMMNCPEGMVCNSCTEVNSKCDKKYWYQPTSNCTQGYCYKDGRCQKVQTKDCGLSYGPSPEWKDNCPEGYICTEAGTYMTSDCKSGTCWRYKSCDTSKDYYLVTSATGTPRCKYMPCYKTQTKCDGFSLTSCPANGVCEECEITDQYCNTDGTKYKLTGCKTGYHLNYEKTACIKDCVINDEVSSVDIMFASPTFNTNEECKAAEGVETCEGREFYTATSCTHSTKYIPKTCKSGYKLKQETSQQNGGTLVKITCVKDTPQCTPNSCDGYIFSLEPSNAYFSTCQIVNADCSKGATKYKITGCKDGYVYNQGFCDKIAIKVGDVLYSDMTTGRIEDHKSSNKTAIAIIFDVNRKLAISLERYNCQWSKENFDIPDTIPSTATPYGDFNGKRWTQIIADYCKKNNKTCPAVTYCNSYRTAGTNAGDWYLPALGELKEIFENRPTIDKSLEIVGGQPHLGYEHWSSSVFDKSRVWTTDTEEGNFYNYYYEPKTNSYEARAIIEF